VTNPPDDSSELELVAVRIGGTVQIRPAPVHRAWIERPSGRFAKRCLPLLMANQSGWELLNATGFTALWDGGDEISSVRIWPDQGADAPGVLSHFGNGILTWHVPFLFRSPRGYNLLARGPANMPKDGIGALEGVIETDWTSATFTMNWKFTRPAHPVRFEAGEPFAFLVPMRRGELERFRPVSVDAKAVPTRMAEFETFSASRLEFLERMKNVSEAWQRDYMLGREADGGVAPEHQTRLNLRPFECL
jgi:hypothetical protein